MNYRGKNYGSWHVQSSDFPANGTLREQLMFLLRYAILAPSSLNSQPWRFRVSNNQITFFLNSERQLPVSDPERVYAHIGLGAAVENVLIAADFFGFTTTVIYIPKHPQEMTVQIECKKTGDIKIAADHLIHSIPKRQTNRNPYSIHPLPFEFFTFLQATGDADVKTEIAARREERVRIAAILMEARMAAFDNKQFRHELAQYKKNNITRSPIGMPGFTMGFSLFFSLIAKYIIRYLNIIRLTQEKESRILVDHTPAFLFLTTREHHAESWTKTGQRLERILLEAERYNIQSAVAAVPFSPQYQQALRQAIPTDWRPQIFVRLGYSDHPRPGHSPRFSLADVLI